MSDRPVWVDRVAHAIDCACILIFNATIIAEADRSGFDQVADVTVGKSDLRDPS